MVLLDAAMALNLAASVVMNGVCCIHSMHEEEIRDQKQRDEIRQVIGEELARQRRFERTFEQRIQERGALAEQYARDRRHKLIQAKQEIQKQKTYRNGVSMLDGDDEEEEEGDEELKLVESYEEGSWINGKTDHLPQHTVEAEVDREDVMVAKQLHRYVPSKIETTATPDGMSFRLPSTPRIDSFADSRTPSYPDSRTQLSYADSRTPSYADFRAVSSYADSFRSFSNSKMQPYLDSRVPSYADSHRSNSNPRPLQNGELRAPSHTDSYRSQSNPRLPPHGGDRGKPPAADPRAQRHRETRQL